VNILDRLLDYDAWIMGRTLRHCRDLSEDELHRRFDIGWETVQATLEHIVENMELWCDMVHDRRPPHLDAVRKGGPKIDELIARHEAVVGELALFAHAQVAAGNLDGVMLDVFYDPPVPITYGAALCDIVHENMVHRSEIRHMLKRLGAPEIEDYDPISWERAGRP
jgi:uncharacterized damage-inducible protein DinB